MLQIVLARPEDLDPIRLPSAAVRSPALVRHPHGLGPLRSGQVAPRPSFAGTLVEHAPAPLASARSELEDPVGGLDHVRVVLDDEERVLPCLQAAQHPDEPLRVARVETHGRLVQDVKRVAQASPERVRQLDPLRLAAGERLGGAVEREVIEPGLAQILEAPLELGQDGRGDRLAHRVEGERGDEVAQVPHRHREELGDVPALHEDLQGLGLEPVPAAPLADHGLLVMLHEEAGAGLVGLLAEPLEEGKDPAESGRSLEKDLLVRFGERSERSIEGNPVTLRQGLELGHEVRAPGVGPGVQRPLQKRLPGIGDDAPQREGQDVAEAVTFGAGAVGAIEGEELGQGLRELAAASLAGPPVVVAERLTLRLLHEDASVPFAPRDLEALAQPHPVLGGGRDPVHVDLDLRPRSPRHRLVQTGPGGVGPGLGTRPHEPARERAGPQVLGLFARIDRQREPDGHLARAAREDCLEDRVHAVPRDLGSALAADRLPHAGEQEPQMVGDLGDGADGGAPCLRGGTLPDGERGGEAFDRVVIGTRQPFQELLGVGGDALDVATLSFGVDGVEGEGGFPRAADARDHGQGRAGEFHVDVLEVVLAGTVQPDGPGLFVPIASGHTRIFAALRGSVKRACDTRGRPEIPGRP